MTPRWSVEPDPSYYDLKTLIVDRDSEMGLTVVADVHSRPGWQTMEAFAAEVVLALNGVQDAIGCGCSQHPS